jgi:hypothetical protein
MVYASVVTIEELRTVASIELGFAAPGLTEAAENFDVIGGGYVQVIKPPKLLEIDGPFIRSSI